MALKKTKELPSGVTGEYWAIDGVSLNKKRRWCEIEILLFKDAAARQAGKSSLESKSLVIRDEEFCFAPNDLDAINIYAKAYATVKANDAYFSDAEDV